MSVTEHFFYCRFDDDDLDEVPDDEPLDEVENAEVRSKHLSIPAALWRPNHWTQGHKYTLTLKSLYVVYHGQFSICILLIIIILNDFVQVTNV